MSMQCLAGDRLGSSLSNICKCKYAMSCGWLMKVPNMDYIHANVTEVLQ